MVRSMTGFATKTISIPVLDTHVGMSIALKSLNSRFFDANCKLPYPISNLETEFIQLFKSRLLRGHISFTIHLTTANAFKSKVEPSLPTIAGYLHALEQIKENFSIEGSVSLSNLLLLPNIFTVQEEELSSDAKNLIFTTTNELIDQLITMQSGEGEVLKNDLLTRIGIIEKEIAIIEKAAEEMIVVQKKKVDAALQELEMDDSKFAETHKSALYVMLDKIDIHEEIIRFKNHLKNLTMELTTPGIEKGKRVDFILQELGREINTITAKCSDSTISTHAINVKVELEKAREQNQNIV
ncbi:MAG: YicC/YloC family endoribonuclease [Candidatus Dependentiae bacterium]